MAGFRLGWTEARRSFSVRGSRIDPLSSTTMAMLRALSIALASLLCSAAGNAQQVVLDFEDLVGFAPMPPGYGGVQDWGSWAHSDLVDPNYGVNGAVRIFSVGPQQPILFGQDVVFEGANVVTGMDFSFELYHQGVLVHTSAVLSPNAGGPAVWLPSGYTGLVDELHYVEQVNVHGVDEFTFTVPTQLVPLCFGDGSGHACPCGNSAGAGEGCANSSGAGASLSSAAGSTSVAADDLVVAGGGMLPGQPALLFAANNSLGGGNGVIFGDGLRCAGGGVVRLGVSVPGAAGSASWGPGLASAGGWGAGDVRYLQAWYRDPVGGACGSGFNLSHSLEALLTP